MAQQVDLRDVGGVEELLQIQNHVVVVVALGERRVGVIAGVHREYLPLRRHRRVVVDLGEGVPVTLGAEQAVEDQQGSGTAAVLTRGLVGRVGHVDGVAARRLHHRVVLFDGVVAATVHQADRQ